MHPGRSTPSARAALAVALALVVLGPSAPARAQNAADTGSPSSEAVRATPVPFGVGEDLQYAVAVGGARVGTGAMTISGIDTVQGHPTYHAEFTVDGGFLMFKVHDVMETWFDIAAPFSSRRFIQHIHEVKYKAERYYDFYPEQSLMQKRGGTPDSSVSDPLDDASFLYFVRTVPLEVGQTYKFRRYFIPDRNPVIVKVLGKERVTVPAGTFEAIVIQPIIKSKGLFSEGGEARMWLTDDDRRIMVQFKAKVPILKTLDLYLTSYRPPTTADAATPR